MRKRGMRLLAALAMAMATLTVLGQGAAQAARDWSTAASKTADGAFVLGNPNAKVRLVEYLSFTCSHCAEFNQTGVPPLKAAYIRKGLVSLEIRHALRDPFDMAAALLARCGGPRTYFTAATKLFAKQGEWGPRAAAYEPPGATKMTRSDALFAAAKAAGLPTYLGRGMNDARVRACLDDPAEQELLGRMADEAWHGRDIGGTPAFLINGKLLADMSSWSALEPQIAAALR